MQRRVKLLGNGVGEALQHPSDIAVAPKQEQRVMVHIAALFFIGLANRLVLDRVVLDKPTLGQHLDKGVGLHGELAFLLGIDIPCWGVLYVLLFHLGIPPWICRYGQAHRRGRGGLRSCILRSLYILPAQSFVLFGREEYARVLYGVKTATRSTAG